MKDVNPGPYANIWLQLFFRMEDVDQGLYAIIISSPTKLRRDIVTLPSVLPSVLP